MASLFSNQLNPVPRTRLYQEVASRVEELILSELKPGDRLPTERDLARALGVSRGSLRDALLRLEVLGLVDSRPRSGTMVLEAGASTLIPALAGIVVHSRPLVTELFDFRKMVEPPLAAHAARNATQGDIAELEAILARQASKVRSGNVAIDEDFVFHCALAKASQNVILAKMIDVVMDLLAKLPASRRQRVKLPSRCLSSHRQIVAAIKRHDAAGAARAMSLHLTDLQKSISIASRNPKRVRPRRTFSYLR